MTEKELIEGCIRNDVSCQRLLFQQYAGRLMTVCLRYARDQSEAEDILQEAFIKIFRNLHQYSEKGAFGKWMQKIVVNCALRWMERKKICFEDITDKSNDSFPAHDADALSLLSEEEISLLIRHLPDGYRIVFNLYVMEGYNHDEIASLLNIKPVTSRSQLMQAKRVLQQQILSMKKIAWQHDDRSAIQ